MTNFDTKWPGMNRRSAMASLAGATLAPWVQAGGHGFEVIHAFTGGDGTYPNGSLVQDAEGRLYGTAGSGGAFNEGTVFRCTKGGKFKVIESFSTVGPLGDAPRAGLCLAADGRLYGANIGRGEFDLGTLFSVGTRGRVRPVHAFNGADGQRPTTELLAASDGYLYGTTWSGGRHLNGVLYRVKPGGAFKVLRHFQGGYITAKLIEGADGWLYTVSEQGGTGKQGAVIRLSPDGSVQEQVHSFAADRSEGAKPTCGLMQSADGSLVGICPLGGLGGQEGQSWGTVFRVTLTGELTVLHHFTGKAKDAGTPSGPLIEDAAGRLYGVTRAGGAAGAGTVYAIDPDGTFTLVHSFAGSDGSPPTGALLAADDGRLYGTTLMSGGIYRLKPS